MADDSPEVKIIINYMHKQVKPLLEELALNIINACRGVSNRGLGGLNKAKRGALCLIKCVQCRILVGLGLFALLNVCNAVF